MVTDAKHWQVSDRTEAFLLKLQFRANYWTQPLSHFSQLLAPGECVRCVCVCVDAKDDEVPLKETVLCLVLLVADAKNQNRWALFSCAKEVMFPSVSISLVCPFVGWMVACLTGLSEGLRKNKILNIASSDVFRHFCSYCTVSHGFYETHIYLDGWCLWVRAQMWTAGIF